MSFYRPPDGTLPSLQEEDAHEYSTIANGGGKNNDARVIVEAVTSPRATSQPLTVAQPSLKQVDFAQPQPKKRANATRFIIPPEDCKNWTETYCCYSPLGICSRLQADSSVYCCLDNVDGLRCTNLVRKPSESRCCSSGWHKENERFFKVQELAAKRQTNAMKEAQAKLADHVAAAAYFNRCFPAANATSSSSNSNSSEEFGSRNRSAARGEPALNESAERRHELRQWGSHGVDRWWEGEWRNHRIELTQPPVHSAPAKMASGQ